MDEGRGPVAVGNVIFFPYGSRYCAFSPSNSLVMLVPDRSAATVTRAVAVLKPKPPQRPARYRALSLFLTTRCNMRCIYCYGKGGDRQVSLDWGTIKTYFDFYLSKKPRYPIISFHGGGEPTLEGDLILRTVAYAKARGVALRPGTFAVGTNGLIPPALLESLIGNRFAFSISYDGLPEVQAKQRPLGRSAAHPAGLLTTEQTISRVARSGNPYCISCTVTDSSVGRMAEMVRHMKSIGGDNIWFHTAFPAGRCGVGDGMLPQYKRFFAGMRAAEAAAREADVKLGRSDPFCSFTIKCAMASLATLAVSSDGAVTGCLEVCTRQDEFSDAFILGGIRDGRVWIDEDKVKLFRERTPERIRQCRGCYIRPICSGSCPIHCLRINGDVSAPDPAWCRHKRSETMHMLQRIAQASLGTQE